MVRLTFPALSYDDYKSTFTGKIDVGIILTMNADQNYYDEHYKPRMEEYFWPFHFLNGKTEILASLRYAAGTGLQPIPYGIVG